jgi:hypothetical protein
MQETYNIDIINRPKKQQEDSPGSLNPQTYFRFPAQKSGKQKRSQNRNSLISKLMDFDEKNYLLTNNNKFAIIILLITTKNIKFR